MIIVLTNDDGIFTEKMDYTKKILEKFGTVYRVAPKVEMSAKSMSLTIGGFHVEKLDEFNYAVEGTPVDCVNFAYAGLDIVPDIIVSGTNNGYNMGIDIKYSGTLGACFQGQYFGFPTIGLSADRKGNVILEAELEKTLQYVFDNNLPSKDYTININFPREKFGTAKGIMHTEVYHQVFEYKPEFEGTKFVPHRQFIIGDDVLENTDVYAYREGYISISKIKI